MNISLGLNGSTVPRADLETGIRAAAKAGFELYEPRVPALKDCAGRDGGPNARRLLGEARLAWLPLNALEDVFFLPPDELDARAEEIFALAELFGVSRVIAVPGRKGRNPLTHKAALDQLAVLAARAGRHGLTLLYELIGFPIHHFPTLDQALELSKGSGIPMVLDTFHLAVSRTPATAVAALPKESIGHVHLSDALTAGKTPETLTDDDRVLPGEGGLELHEYMKAIAETGYRGPVSVEVFHPKYGEQNPETVAAEAHRQAVQVLDAAGLGA